MTRGRWLLAAFILALPTLALAAEKDRWINVHVVEAKDKTNVDIRLPLSLVSVALDAIETDQLKNGKLNMEFSHAKLDFKKLWLELRKYDNTDFVKVESDKEKVLVSRKGGLFVVQVFAPQKQTPQVQVKIPVELMDALVKCEGNELDLKALLSQLAVVPSGDLVTVEEDDTQVRIWID